MGKKAKLGKTYTQITKDWVEVCMHRISGAELSGTDTDKDRSLVPSNTGLVVVDRDRLAKQMQDLCDVGIYCKGCSLGRCYVIISACEVDVKLCNTDKESQGYGKVESGEHDTG